MNWADLIPAFPQGADAWEGFIAALTLFALKLIRPTLLKKRSTYVDRFGWSILLFDGAFGILAGLSMIFTLYPGLNMTEWIGRIVLGLVILTALWQTIEVIIARPVRVERAMAGTAEPVKWQDGFTEDRRVTLRRADDIVRYGESDKYRAILRGDL